MKTNSREECVRGGVWDVLADVSKERLEKGS